MHASLRGGDRRVSTAAHGRRPGMPDARGRGAARHNETLVAGPSRRVAEVCCTAGPRRARPGTAHRTHQTPAQIWQQNIAMSLSMTTHAAPYALGEGRWRCACGGARLRRGWRLRAANGTPRGSAAASGNGRCVPTTVCRTSERQRDSSSHRAAAHLGGAKEAFGVRREGLELFDALRRLVRRRGRHLALSAAHPSPTLARNRVGGVRAPLPLPRALVNCSPCSCAPRPSPALRPATCVAPRRATFRFVSMCVRLVTSTPSSQSLLTLSRLRTSPDPPCSSAAR